MLGGARLPFDVESRRLYDIVAPQHDETHFEGTLTALSERLPGQGTLLDRYEQHRTRLLVRPDRLQAVFTAALEECRRRTSARIGLPDGETFSVAYVSNQPWSAYNWYEGRAASRIEVNTDVAMTVDRALDLACHEGYPGHHVYNCLLEHCLTAGRRWMEFAVYPLFSPQSVIAEGTANFGIEMAFRSAERIAFEREVLYPLADVDPALASMQGDVRELVGRLHYAGNEAARRYLDGMIDAETAVGWLTRYAMSPVEAARQRIRFFDRYRSYVITYNVGLDLVRGWVDRHAGTTASDETRWRAFEALLTSPRVPSDLN